MMKYQINLIQQLRIREQKEQALKNNMTLLTVLAFTLLAGSIGFTATHLLHMKSVIEKERRKLARIEAEYKKYKATRMIVDKADIELLDRLQTGRIFWTKKLAAMAFHLPNKPPNPYWITKFKYDRNTLTVNGFGFISPQQEQLITIDDYLNSLRNDTTFSDVFTSCYFNYTKRDDEGYRERVTFDYSAIKPAKKRRR
ncbi:MAG: hypothetical protein JW863_07695 [Chitinispirillaceae bacterium]|nr:hypothetical protein [Chitinispirillaceae bacterium]